MGQKCLVPKRKKEVTSGFERHRGTKWTQTAPKTTSTTRTQNFFFRTFRDINVFFTRCNFCRYFLGLPFIFDLIEMLASRQLLFDTLHTNQWWSPQCSYSKFFVTLWLVKRPRKYVTVVFFHTIKVADSSHQVVASDQEQNVILHVSLVNCT